MAERLHTLFHAHFTSELRDEGRTKGFPVITGQRMNCRHPLTTSFAGSSRPGDLEVIQVHGRWFQNLGNLSVEGISRGCLARLTLNRSFGCLAMEFGLGRNLAFVRYTSPEERLISIWWLWVVDILGGSLVMRRSSWNVLCRVHYLVSKHRISWLWRVV